MPAPLVVGVADDQRGLRADHDQAAAGLAGEVRHGGRVLGVEGDVLADLEGATVARSDVERAAAWALGELLRDRVLAAAGAEQQNIDAGVSVHGVPPWTYARMRSASVAIRVSTLGL